MTIPPAEARPDTEFRLSITEALKEQLAATIALCSPAPLELERLSEIRQAGGVYQLYLDGTRVYVGKADDDLPGRLTRHYWKIRGRDRIDVSRVTFVCVYVLEDLAATAPEQLLIKKYAGSAGLWNTNGFGNKDPGKERDTSAVTVDHFDADYPINLNWPCAVPPGTYAVSNLFDELKRILPYTFRFARPSRSSHHIDLVRTTVSVESAVTVASRLLEMAADVLPSGWQITALPGYVIAYPERRDYTSALRVWRS